MRHGVRCVHLVDGGADAGGARGRCATGGERVDEGIRNGRVGATTGVNRMRSSGWLLRAAGAATAGGGRPGAAQNSAGRRGDAARREATRVAPGAGTDLGRGRWRGTAGRGRRGRTHIAMPPGWHPGTTQRRFSPACPRERPLLHSFSSHLATLGPPCPSLSLSEFHSFVWPAGRPSFGILSIGTAHNPKATPWAKTGSNARSSLLAALLSTCSFTVFSFSSSVMVGTLRYVRRRPPLDPS